MKKTIYYIKKTLLLIAIINLLFASITLSMASSVVINEIMYDPPAGQKEPDNEWIELYNTQDTAIDIGGWTIRDRLTSSGHIYTIPTGTSISANGYLVLARNATAFNSKYGFNPDLEYGSSASTLKLNNGGDDIILNNSDGAIVDKVSYYNSWGGNGNGFSLERINPNRESNDQKNWGDSSSVGGTPRAQNSKSPSIPEFPTVAIPIAILLGIMLIRFRKKSNR